ncbi:MAG: hypothetical protein JWO13_3338 [Acidobacteriales bacterium]|nr:hypothetical protein [Terriglobales bacterium]
MIVSLNTIESPLIFITDPLNTGSFSRKLYCFFAAFSTIAIIPDCVFTIPLSTTWSMIKQRAPVVHTDVPFILSSCNRIGLTKGSRRPAVLTTDFTSLFSAGLAVFAGFAFVIFGVIGLGAGFVFANAGVVAFGAAFFGAAVCNVTVCEAGLVAAGVGLVTAGFAEVVGAGFEAVGFAVLAGVVDVCASALPASRPAPNMDTNRFLIFISNLTS